MEIRTVKFRVGHEWRVGGLYLPSRDGSSPGVLMLHGFPGLQKNDDIAAELCRRGVTVFTPHFRGCWGSGGRYGLHGLMEDARAALKLLSRYHHVDPARLGVLGVSVGGWIALKLAAEARLAAAAVMAPALPRLNAPADADYLRRNGKAINIPDFEEVWREYLDIARTERPELYIRDISPTPLLVLQGLQDTLVPPGAVKRLWSMAAEPKQLREFPGEGHEFENDRPAVIAAACDWLEARLFAPSAAEIPEMVDVGGGD
jgi:dienelactone hydrolase